MKETLINYTAAMVKAKLAGRKTQTRRIINQDILLKNQIDAGVITTDEDERNGWQRLLRLCPYGKPGDLLLVREGYQVSARPFSGRNRIVMGHYLADGKDFTVELTEKEFAKLESRKYPFRKTPGRFIYKSLIRIRDVITEVRAQRVQDISEEDCRAEGLEVHADGYSLRAAENVFAGPKKAFAYLWDSINAKPKPIIKNYKTMEVDYYYSSPREDIQEDREHRGKLWRVVGNPYVWAITFKPEGTR